MAKGLPISSNLFYTHIFFQTNTQFPSWTIPSHVFFSSSPRSVNIFRIRSAWRTRFVAKVFPLRAFLTVQVVSFSARHVRRACGRVDSTTMIIRVSCTVFKKISKSPSPMEQLTIQSLGFLVRFQKDIKIPQPHGTINHTVIRFSCTVSKRYQNPPAPWNN